MEYKSEHFLDLPTEVEVKNCYEQFYAFTSQPAVKMVVCGVCAREVGCVDEEVTCHRISDIPNGHRLYPKNRHSSHVLYDGKILETAGIELKGQDLWINICRRCCNSLMKSLPDLPPAFTLANNMWIGPIPNELNSLTFPEQLLLSHLYPRVFLFKLYPKKGYSGDPNTLQRGMRGTVSTFALDLSSIASMVEGNVIRFKS